MIVEHPRQRNMVFDVHIYDSAMLLHAGHSVIVIFNFKIAWDTKRCPTKCWPCIRHSPLGRKVHFVGLYTRLHMLCLFLFKGMIPLANIWFHKGYHVFRYRKHRRVYAAQYSIFLTSWISVKSAKYCVQTRHALKRESATK